LSSCYYGFTTCSRTRIPGILMNRKEKNGRVVVKDTLRSVAVMHVPINNGDTLNLRVMILSITGCDCHIIKKTKSHCSFSRGMVTGWSHWNKSIGYLIRHDQVYRLACG